MSEKKKEASEREIRNLRKKVEQLEKKIEQLVKKKEGLDEENAKLNHRLWLQETQQRGHGMVHIFDTLRVRTLCTLTNHPSKLAH